MDEGTQKSGKRMRGTVVKTAMKDTATVSVESYVKHPKYKKYLRRSKKYLVHDPGNAAKVGDVAGYVVDVRPGRVIFEIDGASEPTAREALRKAGTKLPVKVRIVARE